MRYALGLLLVVATTATAGENPAAPGESLADSVDAAYGSKIRQIKYAGGQEHNFYYYRNPWNADGSRMLTIQSDLDGRNWRVILRDGDGRFEKQLFTTAQFDWRLAWDRNNPDVLYTWRASDLYKYDVARGKADVLKSFAPLGLKPNGPSLNQAGDRVLVITSDGVFHSYRLSDMQDERTFKSTVPPGCEIGWDKPHYTGYRNYIDTAYRLRDLLRQAIVIYDDTGAVVHTFDNIGGGGHYDFSPDGKLAYFKMPQSARQGGERPLEIHVVSLDGTGDKVLYSVPQSQARYVQNLHLSWPDKVGDWFVASLFPAAGNLPPAYAPPLDEIIQVRTDGTWRYLARTGTAYSRSGARGAAGDMFWAQPLARPGSDGRRIAFNSNRSGTINEYILYVPQTSGGEGK